MSHFVPLGVLAANIMTALSVFGVIICVVLKLAGIWQYVVVYFESLIAATSALNYWSVLVNKNSVRILPFVNQQEMIVSHDKFKAKLVNLPPNCITFEINNMSFDSCHCFYFALVTFGSQADLNFAVKLLVVSIVFSIKRWATWPWTFSFLVASAPSVVVDNSLVSSWLVSLESDLAKLSVLVESIVKSIGSMVKIFEQFVNSDLVSSAALGLRVNEVLVHMGFFSKAVGKLKWKVIALKSECGFEDIDMSGPHVIELINNSATLFEIVQRMSSLNKFSSDASM
ncbi:hypothetical protein G9A89_023197 [Geosiphon pyriformis]|nr:hypothetical protein G9A89_023197 [Geosiphon pyriformis]